MSESKYDNPQNLNRFQHFFYDYGRYHNNTVNILIHCVFVPIIFTSLMAMTWHLSKNVLDLNFNIGLLLPLAATPLYIYVDLFIGTLTSIQYLLLGFYSQSITFGFDGISDIKIISAIHIFAWITQFIGHGAFEGRKPALMDNLLLTLNAPIFVNLEIGYYGFGYKKEQIDETKHYIVAEIKKFRGEKTKSN